MGLKFCSDFFWVRDFGLFGGLTKSENQVSRSYIMMQKLSGILLNYYYYIFFNCTFLGYVPGRWTFFGSGSSLKDFFWV